MSSLSTTGRPYARHNISHQQHRTSTAHLTSSLYTNTTHYISITGHEQHSVLIQHHRDISSISVASRPAVGPRVEKSHQYPAPPHPPSRCGHICSPYVVFAYANVPALILMCTGSDDDRRWIDRFLLLQVYVYVLLLWRSSHDSLVYVS